MSNTKINAATPEDAAYIQHLIEEAFAQKDWQYAKQLIATELNAGLNNDNHWLLTKLSNAFYEEYKYKEAYRLSKRAFQICPNCPLVRWDLASVLYMLDFLDEAISHWKWLIERSQEQILADSCWESEEWTKRLQNDCRYRLSVALNEQDKGDEAMRYIKEFFKHYDSGVRGIYSKKEVEGWFADLEMELSNVS